MVMDSCYDSISCSFLISGYIWMPYTLLLYFLTLEHVWRRNFPHYFIMGLFSLGATLRTLWFLLASIYGKAFVVFMIINRAAILFQFSGLSVLILMWARCIKVTSKGSENSKSMTTNDYLWIISAFVINVAAWLFILLSISNASTLQSSYWYSVNSILVSLICFLESIVIFVVGVRTGLRLQRELMPVYITGGSRSNSSFFDSAASLYKFIYSRGSFSDSSSGLQIQKKAVRVMMSVSIILATLFLIRSFCFMYTLLVAPYITNANTADILDRIIYPNFFYEVPELVPTIAVARGIAPPDSILKNHGLIRYIYRFFRWITFQAEEPYWVEEVRNSTENLDELNGRDSNISIEYARSTIVKPLRFSSSNRDSSSYMGSDYVSDIEIGSQKRSSLNSQRKSTKRVSFNTNYDSEVSPVDLRLTEKDLGLEMKSEERKEDKNSSARNYSIDYESPATNNPILSTLGFDSRLSDPSFTESTENDSQSGL